GATPEHLARVLAVFRGLPHRLEPVASRTGRIRWINDSISTAPEAAVAALQAFAGEVETLIVGGSDRGFDCGVLARALPEELRHVICLPPGGGAVEAAIRAVHPPGKPFVYSAQDLADAVAYAARVTVPGRVCLFSPASPSYGIFRNFEDRGE